MPASRGSAARPPRTVRLYRPPWRLDLTNSSDLPPLVPATVIARLVDRALRAAGAPAPASIGVILSDDDELEALNEEHMGNVGPTDVLSFPLLPPDAFPPHPARSVGGPRARSFPLPPGVRQHLGDVVVSVERAVAQAAAGQGGQTNDARWAASDELRLLIVHGVLHVCGWDHADPTEGAAMRALEQELLASP